MKIVLNNITLGNTEIINAGRFLRATVWLGNRQREIVSKGVLDQFSSVTQSCPTLCDPMNRSTPGLPVHHHLPEFTQTQIHWVRDAISSLVVPFSSCPQSLSASDSLPMSQLFAWGSQSTGVSALALFLPKKSQGWSPLEYTSICFSEKVLVVWCSDCR